MKDEELLNKIGNLVYRFIMRETAQLELINEGKGRSDRGFMAELVSLSETILETTRAQE